MLGDDGCGVLVLEERFGNVVWHVDVDRACGVVPIDIDAAEEGTGPIQAESYVAPDVAPQPRGVLAAVKSTSVETLFEKFVSKDSGLWKAIHAHSNFNVYPPLVIDEVSEIVRLDNFVGY
jgi:hypothetical protein